MNEPNPGKASAHNLDLRAIDAVLDAFLQAAQNPDTSRRKLYENFHSQIIACTDSIASAVFSKQPKGQFTMVSQSGWKELDPPTLATVKESIKEHYSDNSSTHASSSTHVFVGKSNAVKGVEYLYVLVRRDEPNELINEVFKDLAKEIASQIESHEIRRAAAKEPKTAQDLTHLVQVTQNIGKSRTLTQMGMHLVNDLAKSIEADRVCYFQPNGKLIAVSGVSHVSLKTSFARNLSRLARIAVNNRSEIESSEDLISVGEIRRSSHIKPLIDSLESERIFIGLLEDEGKCCGAVSFEFFDATVEQEWVDKRQLINHSLAFVAPLVRRAEEFHSIPGIHFLDLIFNRIVRRPIANLLWFVSLSMILLALCYILFFLERPFAIHAEGVLQPVSKRNIFAPRQGEIRQLFVEEGTVVEAGAKLVEMESKELRDQIIVVEGELAEANQQLQNLLVADFENKNSPSPDEQTLNQQAQIASDIERLRSRTSTLNQRLELFGQQLSELSIKSPIEGQVTTTDVANRLESRPVDRGDLLMTVSELDGEWELILDVPDSRVEFIRGVQDPSVRFRVAADSEHVYQGKIREFDYRVESSPEDQQTFAHAYVDFNEIEIGTNLRLQSRVIAKIECGQRSNWFLLTYELKNKVSEWFFF